MRIMHDDVHPYWNQEDCSEPQLILDPIVEQPNGWNNSMGHRDLPLKNAMERLKISIQYGIQFKNWKHENVSQTVFYANMISGLIRGGSGLQLGWPTMDEDWQNWKDEDDEKREALDHYRVGILRFILDHVCIHGNGKSLRQQQESMIEKFGFAFPRQVVVTLYTREYIDQGRLGFAVKTFRRRVRTRSDLRDY